MSADTLIQFTSGLPGVLSVTSSESGGDPEGSWGDTFFFYDPTGDTPANQRFPFSTLVVQDYAGFDEASDLNRDGVFRLNIAVGRDAYEHLIGHSAARHTDHAADFDYTELDRVIPHPVYASQGWISILNPGERTMNQAEALLRNARDLAAKRHERRGAAFDG